MIPQCMICYVFIINYFIVTSWTVVLHISVLLNFQTGGSLPVRFLLVISSLNTLCSENIFWTISIFEIIKLDYGQALSSKIATGALGKNPNYWILYNTINKVDVISIYFFFVYLSYQLLRGMIKHPHLNMNLTIYPLVIIFFLFKNYGAML